LGAINSHIVDSFNWFLGVDVSSVFCQLQTHVKQRPYGGKLRDVTTDDEANMLIRFADGDLTSDATGLVSVSMVEQPEYVNRLEIFGTEGAIRIEHRGEVSIAKTGEKEWTEIDVEYASPIPGIPDTGFARGFMAFAPKIVEAIASGASSIEHAATFEDGLKVQRVLDSARDSNARRVSVSL
jgi:predicted dehydrogenase